MKRVMFDTNIIISLSSLTEASYRAALAAGVDYLITGDKDLLEFNESSIKIIRAADFIEIHESRM
jgi:predicted nucleic acid-binding protein